MDVGSSRERGRARYYELIFIALTAIAGSAWQVTKMTGKLRLAQENREGCEWTPTLP
jgi:hypothetical protein